LASLGSRCAAAGVLCAAAGLAIELFIIKLVCPRPLALLRTLELAVVGINYRKFLLP
jgi:hypothetical protein